MPISAARRHNARGLATVEVLVAVAIIVMIGSLAVFTLGSTDRRMVARETADISLFLQQTRMRALELGRPIEIVVVGSEGRIAAGGLQHQVTRDMVLTPDEAQLVLQPTGASDGLTLQVAKGNHIGTVTLDWLTGRVDTQ
ncbi:hypothetical protein BC777_2917 [Yoonia maricola]|uniref:General secretion pathway protein H n=2 Tax=Yoonia maricola TaxID=420999 RepID=A0A2M8W1X5_9RHOB|nr:hypothetical protein BC777_2917 [Yoonia maricola]